MSENFPSELISAIVYLLPGFVAAWVFYGLTSHPKPSQFERTVQALIFTFIVRALIPPIKWSCFLVGDLFKSSLAWSEASDNFLSLTSAFVLGVGLAYAANTDSLHILLRKINLTSRTSHPSEWFYVFSEKVRFVVLQLKDGRRLYGWPKEWPVEPDKGQFYMMLPAWITEDGTAIDLNQLDGILIKAVDVQWIEFLNKEEGDENV